MQSGHAECTSDKKREQERTGVHHDAMHQLQSSKGRDVPFNLAEKTYARHDKGPRAMSSKFSCGIRVQRQIWQSLRLVLHVGRARIDAKRGSGCRRSS
jgi:hypothetical protein